MEWYLTDFSSDCRLFIVSFIETDEDSFGGVI